ncbi:MAG: T9SS type A sorting domain-containing protein, partial [Salinivirgaceae bacterium]|nr:T9SS type A sorting domain-containing protein [Salinivirgaceae bacterium]
GNSWQQVMDDFPVYDISINPENNQNMWGVVYTGYTDWLLFFSNDGGQNWNLYEGFEDPYKWVTSMYADADFNLYIEREKVETTGTEIKKSTDNGISWFTLDNFPAEIFENRLDADNTNTDNVYFGTYYGVYHSENGGVSTQLENAGLMNSYIYDLEVHPVNSDIVYAGGKQGLWKSTDGCRNWQQIMDKSIMHIRYNPTYPDTLYLGGSLKLLRSFNGGSTFENIYNNINGGISAISVNPKYSNIVFISTGVDDYVFPIYKSTDYGNTWTHVFTSQNSEAFVEILIDTFYPDTVYFGKHRSIDGGTTWLENALEIRIVAIHPDNSDILYASDGNNLKISYDWGETFQLLDSNSNWTVPKLTIYKENPDYLFYCTPNDGVRYSEDAGENWQKLEGSYENRTFDIIPLVNENKYYIATHGDGVWVYDLSTGINIKKIKQATDLMAYPNPFKDNVTIELPGNQGGNFLIINSIGEKIIASKIQSQNKLVVNLTAYKNGIYLIIYTDNKGIQYQQKLIKM